MSGVQRLPPEIWRMAIRDATSTNEPVSASRESILDADSTEGPPCLKNDLPLTPVLYHRHPGSRQSPLEAFTQAGTKRSIALVCRTFNRLVGEFLFEKLYISEPKSAHRLADTLESSAFFDRPGRWTRHITIVGVFFTFPPTSFELATAAVRILARTPHLHSFHLSWNATSREFREREQLIVAAVPTSDLRHFEWVCTGGGFERQQDHPFYQLLNNSRATLRVLKLRGYLPLAELEIPRARAEEVGDGNTFPELTHCSIRRAFRDDLLFISQWDISARLTCLSLGSIWAYFDHRELAFSFWDTPKPSLRCLHLGEGSNVSHSLARKMLDSSPRLRLLEYFYLGEWEADTWVGANHTYLETVRIHVSHPLIALRSLFNSQRFSRDQQWDKILRHVSPFLGRCVDFQVESSDEDEADRTTSASHGTLSSTETNYPAMKKLVFTECTRNSEDLRYEPAELAKWLRSVIAEVEMKTDVEVLVEVEDYIR